MLCLNLLTSQQVLLSLLIKELQLLLREQVEDWKKNNIKAAWVKLTLS
jgi:hypothetical protein